MGQNTSSHNGWVGKTNQGAGNANTRFYFGRVDGEKFKPFSDISNLGDQKDDDAVLKLGAACPPGSVGFSRHFDNENGANANFSDGNIFPNVSNANTTLNFCMFRAAQLGDPIINVFPSLAPGFQYGVFGPPASMPPRPSRRSGSSTPTRPRPCSTSCEPGSAYHARGLRYSIFRPPSGWTVRALRA